MVDIYDFAIHDSGARMRRMRSIITATLLIACASGCASPAYDDPVGRSESFALTSCVTLRFDEIPNGDTTPELYTDQGVLITPVVNLYFANSVQLRVGMDFYMYMDATGVSRSAREIKFSWQANF